MANYRWIGTGASPLEYNTGALWEDISDGSTGTIPGALSSEVDTALFDGSGTAPVVFGEPEGNYNNITRLTVAQSYASKFGDGGAPCPVPVNGTAGGEIQYQGSCPEAWFKGQTSTFTARHRGNSANALRYQNVTGVVTTINCMRGRTVVEGVQVSNLYTGWLSSVQNDVRLDVGSGVSVSGAIYLNGGRVEIDTAGVINDVISRNAQLTVTRMGPLGILNIQGGEVIWNHESPLGGINITTCLLQAGILNMTRDSRAKRIGELRHWAGATFQADNGGQNITVDNYYMYGNANLVSGANSFTVLPV